MMPLYKGYAGKILKVNLTTGKASEEVLSAEYIRMFIGGRGLAAKILFDELKANIDPLGPDNKIVIARGPLTGTAMPFSSRFVVATKSPLTGIYAYSIAGGDFGLAFTKGGFDGVVIEGSATEMTILFIDDGEPSLRDAAWIEGATVTDACKYIKRALGSDVKVLTIGPAGEKMVKMASVITDDGRACARCGIGAVFGSKKLKGLVVRGTNAVELADKTAFYLNLKKIHEALQNSSAEKRRTVTGTQAGPLVLSEWGILPTRNWKESVFEGARASSFCVMDEKSKTMKQKRPPSSRTGER